MYFFFNSLKEQDKRSSGNKRRYAELESGNAVNEINGSLAIHPKENATSSSR